MLFNRRGPACALFVGAALSLCAGSAGAITLGQIDTFSDGTTMGWRHGSASSPLPPSNVNTGGPAGAGDAYLRIETDGGEFGAASRMLALNTQQWTGDFLAAGVSSIGLDVRNPNNVDLVLRLAFRGANGSIYVTNGIALPAGAPWTSLSVAIEPGNMAYADGTYADCFGGVTMMRILHHVGDPVGDFGEPVRASDGTAIPAQLGVDNITAVPEPGSLLPAVLGAALLGRRRRDQF